MRRLLAILFIGITVGVLSFAWVGGQRAASGELRAEGGADIAWLKSEFQLSDEQFAAIEQLHADYLPQCTIHCARILGAREAFSELEKQGASADELAAGREEIARLETVCNAATRNHLQSVASAMSAEQGSRFLRMTEPHLAHQPHDGNRGPVR